MRENIRTEERPDGIIPGPEKFYKGLETFYKREDPIKDPFSGADIGEADISVADTGRVQDWWEVDYEKLLEVIE